MQQGIEFTPSETVTDFIKRYNDSQKSGVDAVAIRELMKGFLKKYTKNAIYSENSVIVIDILKGEKLKVRRRAAALVVPVISKNKYPGLWWHSPGHKIYALKAGGC